MKRLMILAAIAALAGLPALSEAQAKAPLSAKDREAIRLHRKRDLDRYQQRRDHPQTAPIESQRSRPIPPASPNSQVVPNR
ncbi:hypothetical protein [Bosea sp. (in: a-proteobacteria)]|uniref:hypothetical protein n=1 Tax=Bosea sp. (in: a-proteobacteria) TaxID=1871050 RepID=UPI00121887CF|nr:hypothetical protein [Bosea sp. (in: a-proteobacteria)]TAJ31605.1 MAG: hypothetical protein EPO59_07815 [Bosea sp. (in: a-proteobacteria)]